MGKNTHTFILVCFVLAGCMLDRSGTAVLDTGIDASLIDASSFDASDNDAVLDTGIEDSGSFDANIPDAVLSDSGILDSGTDTGIDSGTVDSGIDSGLDAGIDTGMPDAGPPRVLVFEFERTLSGGPVRSFWTREGPSGTWRSMCVRADITSSRANVWRCTYDRVPLPSREEIRFYADFTEIGVSPACGFSNCTAVGVHRLYLDGVMVAPIDISPVDSVSPYPPAGMIKVNFYLTPP